MMTFDEKIRTRAKREGSPIPRDYDNRINNLLAGLPAQVEKPRCRHFPLKRTVVIAAVAAVFVVGAGAVPAAVLSMKNGAIDYFNDKQDSSFVYTQEAVERYNTPVGVSQTNAQGQTLTIDNLSVDDSYINIFYTLTSETAIEKPGDDNNPDEWRAKWAAPVFWAIVDGKELDTSGNIEGEAYFVDDCTLEGMHRLSLRVSLPDTFELLLYTGGTSERSDADFTFAMNIDKSAVSVESLTVEPKKQFQIQSGAVDEKNRKYDFTHDVTIERIAIAPTGSTIILSEVTNNDCGPFASFVLRDDKGKYLPIIVDGLSGSGFLRNAVKNVFEFAGADLNTKSITLIPFTSSNKPYGRVEGSIDALPLTDDSPNGYTLEKLEIGAKKTVATFSTHGAIANASMVEFKLLDENGDDVTFSSPDGCDGAFIDSSFDRKTGMVTSTIYYPNATADEVEKIKKVSFLQQEELVLQEDKAVTIELSK